jgi:hypothetical protein
MISEPRFSVSGELALEATGVGGTDMERFCQQFFFFSIYFIVYFTALIDFIFQIDGFDGLQKKFPAPLFCFTTCTCSIAS